MRKLVRTPALLVALAVALYATTYSINQAVLIHGALNVNGVLTAADGAVLGTPASGDATNLTNIPVANAKSGSVLPGANGGGMVLISDQTLAMAAGSVTFSSFSGYKDLKLFVQAACSSSSTNQGVSVTVNSDSGNNYTRQYTIGGGTTTTTGQNASTAPGTAPPLIVECATGLTNGAGQWEMTFHNYAGTVFSKYANAVGTYETTNAATGIIVGNIGWHWNSTAAITGLVLAPVDASNFIIGSRFTLYGVN